MKIIAAACASMMLVCAAQAAVTIKHVSAGEAASIVADRSRSAERDLASGGDFRTTLSSRTESSHVEKHQDWNEEIVIQQGDIVLNIGGDAIKPVNVAPGEWRGQAITGGQSMPMHPGDIAVIPADTWHEQVLKSPLMRYILFKTRKEERPKGEER